MQLLQQQHPATMRGGRARVRRRAQPPGQPATVPAALAAASLAPCTVLVLLATILPLAAAFLLSTAPGITSPLPAQQQPGSRPLQRPSLQLLASGPGRPRSQQPQGWRHQRWWPWSSVAAPMTTATAVSATPLSSSMPPPASSYPTDELPPLAHSGPVVEDPLTPSAGKAKRTLTRRRQQLARELGEIEAAEGQGGAGPELYLAALRSCAKAGEVGTAVQLLRDFPPPASRVAYNLVLEAAAQAGDERTALAIYEEMVAEAGIGANVFTYGQLLALHAKRADGDAALALLAEMDKRGMPGNAFTYTSAIDACERAGFPADTTESLLREMAERDVAPTVVTYNVIIARRAERPDTWQEALDWLARLEKSGLQPLRSSYAAALNACERAEDWPLVIEVVDRAAAQGVADAALWSRDLAARLRLERYEEVLETVRRLQAQAQRAKEKPQKDKDGVAASSAPDEVMYTLALKACALGRRSVEEARALLEEMREAGLEPNVVTFSAAMEACKTDGNWEMALELLREMQAQGVRPNTVTYSILLDLLTEAGQWQRALHMFMTLEKEGVARTVWLYTAAIRACARGQQLDTAMALLREVTDSPALREHVNLRLYTAALDACEKVGNGSLALQLLEEMHRDFGLVVDDVACGVVISACRKAGLVADCLRLLAFMLNHRLCPNLGVYNTVIGALCSQPEFLEKAVEVLAYLQQGTKRAAKRRGRGGDPGNAVPKPNAQSYAQVINALADALRWEEALGLLKEMRRAGHRPEVLTCAKVVAACERRQRWKEALQLLDEMRTDDYDFYELELLNQVFKKLLGVAAAGVRSLTTAPAAGAGAGTGAAGAAGGAVSSVVAGAATGEDGEDEEDAEDADEDDRSSGARRLLGESKPIAAGVSFAQPERVR